MTGPSGSLRGRVAVAMSGGVDSAVAALMLKQDGWDVIGVTLRMHDCKDDSAKCCSAAGPGGVVALAAAIGVPHFTVDCRAEFAARVLFPAWQEYSAGRTPSPCITCNETIKFGLLREWARSNGAEMLATGHYASVSAGPVPRFLRPADRAKDQTYFLSRVRPDDGLLFPLRGLTKPEVRDIARTNGLAVADAAESQDACYLSPEAGFAELLMQRFGGVAVPGRLVDESGREIGRHDGIHLFTVGQRRGFCIGDSRRRWVLRIDAATGDVALTTDPALLQATGMIVSRLVMPGGAAALPVDCSAVVRHGQVPVPAVCETMSDGRVHVRFAQPVRAVTPGQAAAFYDGDLLIGGAWIDCPA